MIHPTHALGVASYPGLGDRYIIHPATARALAFEVGGAVEGEDPVNSNCLPAKQVEEDDG